MASRLKSTPARCTSQMAEGLGPIWRFKYFRLFPSVAVCPAAARPARALAFIICTLVAFGEIGFGAGTRASCRRRAGRSVLSEALSVMCGDACEYERLRPCEVSLVSERCGGDHARQSRTAAP